MIQDMVSILLLGIDYFLAGVLCLCYIALVLIAPCFIFLMGIYFASLVHQGVSNSSLLRNVKKIVQIPIRLVCYSLCCALFVSFVTFTEVIVGYHNAYIAGGSFICFTLGLLVMEIMLHIKKAERLVGWLGT